MQALLDTIPADRPVPIAGPTASGKSAVALALARAQGGVIVNADALQVFANWRILTARPSSAEEQSVPHRLYGHVPGDQSYSVGHWLRDLAPLLTGEHRPIIVGGTGLYFSALTGGLADIPLTPPDIRATADARMQQEGPAALLAELDPATTARIDAQNPARVQRAWEVQATTGTGLAALQDATPPPLLALQDATALVVDAPRDWLRDRIARRFDRMLESGALEEARANLPGWSDALPSAKAIGARDLIAYLRGAASLEAARLAAITASQQYAKRQRTWFRARMRAWRAIAPPGPVST